MSVLSLLRKSVLVPGEVVDPDPSLPTIFVGFKSLANDICECTDEGEDGCSE